MSKICSTFARFFVGTVLYHPSGCEPAERSQTEKRRVKHSAITRALPEVARVLTQARLYSSVGRALDL